MPDFSTKLRSHPPHISAKEIFAREIANKSMLAAVPGDWPGGLNPTKQRAWF